MTTLLHWFEVANQTLVAIEPDALRLAVLVAVLVGLSIGSYAVVRLFYGLIRLRLARPSRHIPTLNIVLKSPFFPRLLKVVPLVVARGTLALFFDNGLLTRVLLVGIQLWFLLICARSFAALMNIFYQIGNERRGVSASPHKGIFQVLGLLGYLFAAVGMIAIVLGRDPTYVLSGLTALSAIFMLIFKDAILGLTAGITLIGNGLVKIGDWIVVPGTDADGDVVDIALTTVRVQNFDKTITSVPAYDLIAKPFTNWRGMVEAGGRRIKRSIKIDLDTVRFADEAMLSHWRKIKLLKDYLAKKEEELAAENADAVEASASMANARHLTNLGTFRAYCIAYLKNHPKIHKNMTLMVRQLPPVESGLPLEIYCFTNTTVWEQYESIQSDIFDHLLAILPEFGLSAFQVTSAGALRNIAKSTIL